ncbi:MAG: DUF1800 domain-containing protein [Chloroflexi bacterium]|nr:DUF1800 domain-containing protein [Chloroflexota bacterium]
MAISMALRALNRFGLGAGIGQRAHIDDERGWLMEQLKGGAPTLAAPDGASPREIGGALRAIRMLGQGGDNERRMARQRVIQTAAAEARIALAHRVSSDRPFVERLVAFWSNHLCVSARAKVLVAPLAGSYERDAIRPHVLGRFDEMVLASARHPAMLFYLDNFQSIGPRSSGAGLGRRAGVQRGLNENYARELLELHTLGVDGGYTQQDVLELARILTGWTVDGVPVPGSPRPGMRRGQPVARGVGSGPIQFVFREALHEPGAKTVLGQRYPEAGVLEGERSIRAICRHPSTARFIATKLVAHFVADEPPPVAVTRVERAFLESEGDLAAVAATLVALPEAWSAESRKFRPPQDWLVAVLRALDARAVTNAAVPLLGQLRHPLWSPQAPAGFGDTAAVWADPDSLLRRAELSRTLARRVVRPGVDPRELLDVVDIAGSDPLHALLADRSIPADERVALAIAGPAFQWR